MTESMEASPNAESDLDAIIAELDAPFGNLPEKAIKAVRLHKEAMIPRLIALIEDAARAAQAGEEVTNKNGHFFALFLLGEFRAREALPAILKAISLPNEGPSQLFGDAIHDVVPGVLAALAGERDLDLVLALIDDKALNQYVRWAAASALVAMVAAGIRTRDEIMQLLRQSLRRAIDEQDTELITGLVPTLDDLYPEEAYDEIKEAYAKHLVDDFMINLSDVERTLAGGRAECLKKLGEKPPFIDDTVEELRHWASFSEPEEEYDGEHEEEYEFTPAPAPPIPRARPMPLPAVLPAKPIRSPEKRVGRNDPCPCGSGKKFKKCCWLQQ
jgi:hypothetical protein